MNKLEMLSHVYSKNKLDLNVLCYFLAKFAAEVDQTDLMYVNKIFLDHDITNSDKIFVLQQIKICGLQYNFDYFNKATKQEFKLDSNSDFEIELQSYFIHAKEHIDKLLMKEPSLIGLASEILVVIYEYFFNQRPEFDEQYLANQLSQYVRTYFDAEIKPDIKFKT
jgi:hypothetical protein